MHRLESFQVCHSMTTLVLTMVSLIASCSALAIESGQIVYPLNTTFQPTACEGSGDTKTEVYFVMGYYADKRCSQELKQITYHSARGTCPQLEKGAALCFPAGIGPETDVFGKVLYASHEHAQLIIVETQQCLNGAPELITTFNAGEDDCASVPGLSGSEGAMIYPFGGSGLTSFSQNQSTPLLLDSHINLEEIEDDSTHVEAMPPPWRPPLRPRCRKFRVESQEDIFTPARQLSDLVNCGQSSKDCGFSYTQGWETTITSSWSVGGGITIGKLDIKAEFGKSYANSVSKALRVDLFIPPGQKGYLASYASATLFKGKFTDCNRAVKEEPDGEVLAVKEGAGSVQFTVVLTTG